MDRAQFLRTGAATVAGAAACGVLAPAALAGLQPVAPAGDDVGFVQFGVLAERVGLTFYRRALKTPGLFGAAERRRLELARHAKLEHVKRLTAVLGEDAHLLAALRSMGGAPGGKGMPIPVDLEAAGPKLDALLKANGYPTV